MGSFERNAAGMPQNSAAATDPREAAFQQIFDVRALKILISLGPEKFQTLYKAEHGDEEYGPDYDGALQFAIDKATMSPGEFMITYSPTHSLAAEALYSVYNKEALAFSNDPTINGYMIERLQDMIQNYDPLDPEAGLTEEEKKQRRFMEAISDAAQDAHEERMKEQKKEFQAQWDKQPQSFGGHEWKGEDLRKFLNWALDNPEELDAVDQQLIAQGVPATQVKTMRQKFEEAAKLKLMQANGEKLTPEQEMLLHKYESDPDVTLYSEKARLRREKGLEFANQTTSLNQPSTSSSYQEQAARQTTTYSQLEENKHDITDQPEFFSLGSRLAQQQSNDSSVNQTQAQYPTNQTVASFQDDFSDVAQTPNPNGLQGQFAQAKTSTVPLDQENTQPTTQHSQLAMKQQAVGLNFS